MQSLTTIIVSVLTWGLTAITKDKVIAKKAADRKLIVRFLAAVFAVGASLGAAMLGDGILDVGLIPIAVDAGIAMFASFGIYQVAPKKAKK